MGSPYLASTRDVIRLAIGSLNSSPHARRRWLVETSYCTSFARSKPSSSNFGPLLTIASDRFHPPEPLTASNIFAAVGCAPTTSGPAAPAAIVEARIPTRRPVVVHPTVGDHDSLDRYLLRRASSYG